MGLIRTKPTPDPEVETIDDLALTQAATLGDSDARRTLANRLFNRIRTTMSYVAKGSDAEDLAQTALIRILRSTDTFRGESSLESWADRIAVRCALKSFEKRNRRAKLFEENWSSSPLIQTTEDSVEQIMARRRLSDLIQELSKHQAVAMVLHYIHGYKIEEISEITEVPVNTIRGRLRNGRKRLRKKILSDPYLSDWIEGRVR